MWKFLLLISITFFAVLIHTPESHATISKGDLNQDGIVDLKDAILGLQVITGQTPTIPNYSSASDVNQNDRIDVSEVIYILQTVENGTGVPNPLNDTGITFGGNYPAGFETSCTSNIAGPQDCSQGRDATHNDDSDGHAGFSFTKLDSGGNSLPANATSWSCVRDNVTGLVWEVKTTDGSIHDASNTYKWGGKTALGSGYGTYYDDWNTLVDGSNSEQLCGYSDWRVPTRQELISLVDYGGNNQGNYHPAIDTDYFPNTEANYYWSASPYGFTSSLAWAIFFYDGNFYISGRSGGWYVRLVRSGQ